MGRDGSQLPGTTWARRGLTSGLRRLSKRREVSSIVAFTLDGRLYARHVRTSVTSPTMISALRYFRRKIGTPLLVVWDRLNAHRSQVTTAFIAARKTSAYLMGKALAELQ
ncbi:transposase [Microvirga terrae]|uniref:Transposase n=1 Tax=Microvirga terrae TaxID=2740529 RepID=A0ABY5RQ86_9HYPH|nr:transposase [Microvirga terrae]UVF18486.1 transposase [Microvirga terrae]